MHPSRGPFSYLPPWMRPGWWFRGYCWWPWLQFFMDPKSELARLKLERENLKELLRVIEERIRELEGEE